MKTYNYIISLIALSAIVALMLPTCNRTNNLHPTHTRDTIYSTDTLLIERTKTVHKTKIKHDSIYIGIDTNKYCETMRIYTDTLTDTNLVVVSIDSVIGVLKSKKISVKNTMPVITNTITIHDSTTIVKEVPKITFKQRVNHLSIGALLGIIATFALVITQ